MIIWLASYPRSGNTFFRHVCWKSFGIKTYSVYSEEGNGANGEGVLGFQRTPFFDFARADIGPGPYLVKTHEQDHAFSGWRAIHMVRDGRAALVSHAHFKQDLEGDKRQFAQILKELILSEMWSVHTLMWMDRTPRPITVQFADLIAFPAREVSRALTEAGMDHPVSQTAPLTFDELHQRGPLAFRQGKADGWKEEFPSCLNQLFWQRHREPMERLGYEEKI